MDKVAATREDEVWNEAIEQAAKFLEGDAILHNNPELPHEANLIRFYLKRGPARTEIEAIREQLDEEYEELPPDPKTFGRVQNRRI